MSVPPRRPWLAPTIALGFGLGLAFVSGCDQPTGPSRPRSRTTPVAVADEPAPPVEQPAPPKPAPVAPRPILGERTQDVRDMKKEQQAGGVVKAPRIVAKDPILLTGNAYVSIVSRTAQLQIQKTLDLYHATNGEYPKTTEEFMEKIIKEGQVSLTKLPFYQEYGYDPATHSLVIIEYPDRKEAANYPK
jgi:hypothetical protein